VVRAQTTASLVAAGSSTHVNVVTELAVTGKAAQFGRGMLEDVSSKLFDQFARALAEQLTAERLGPATSSPAIAESKPANAPAPAPSSSGYVGRQSQASRTAAAPARHSPEVLDLMSVAGSSVVRRYALPALALTAGIALAVLRPGLGHGRKSMQK
jgi:hypothetical protein